MLDTPMTTTEALRLAVIACVTGGATPADVRATVESAIAESIGTGWVDDPPEPPE